MQSAMTMSIKCTIAKPNKNLYKINNEYSGEQLLDY